MLGSRIASWIVFAGVVLTLASGGLLSSVFADWEQSNGPHRLNKLTANADLSAAAASSAGLTLKEAERLTKAWGTPPIAYTARQQSTAKADTGVNKINCTVIGVSGLYRDFAQIHPITGSFVTEFSVAERSRVAAVSEKVADKLYGSVHVIGKTIELWGVRFAIIGVFAEHDSMLKQMADDGIPEVFVPVTAMLDIRPEAAITGIELAAKSDAAVGGSANVQHALTAIGKNPAQFRIGNNVLDRAWIAQQKSLLLFACGIIAIYLLLRLIPAQLATAYARYKLRLATDDWPEALLAERIMLLKHGLIVIGLIACTAVLWKWIRFRLYIPPDWIPEEIIDLSFYMDKLRSLWQQHMLQAGYAPSPQEALAAAAGKLAGRLLMAGMLCGLPLCLLGIRMWTAAGVPLNGQLLRLLLYVPAAAAAAFAAARWAGMDYLIDLRDIAVPVAMFAVAAVCFSNPQHTQRSVDP